MIIWVIGMSGAGKTAIGRELFKIRKRENPATVFIDGDEIRDVFKNDRHAGDYSVEGRGKNAERIRALCEWLDRQDIDVVCCILSIRCSSPAVAPKFTSTFLPGQATDIPVVVFFH